MRPRRPPAPHISPQPQPPLLSRGRWPRWPPEKAAALLGPPPAGRAGAGGGGAGAPCKSLAPKLARLAARTPRLSAAAWGPGSRATPWASAQGARRWRGPAVAPCALFQRPVAARAALSRRAASKSAPLSHSGGEDRATQGNLARRKFRKKPDPALIQPWTPSEARSSRLGLAARARAAPK